MKIPINTNIIIQSIPAKDIKKFISLLKERTDFLKQVIKDYAPYKNEDKNKYIERIIQYRVYPGYILEDAWDYKNHLKKDEIFK